MSKEKSCCSADCCCDEDSIVTVVSTNISFKDMLGAWKVRWGIGRMDYKINPGIYAIGKPDNTSVVLVSANYKLTFDLLRKELSGVNCWLLILDTKGVNVWCAAGKGTFGTDELVNRITKTGLSEIVSHRTLILPQLGAAGVAAYEVKKLTGFKVIYGPVRAKDIKAYLTNDMKATEEMRTVKFTIRDRLVLTPLQLVSTIKPGLMVLGVMFILNLFVSRTFGLSDFILGAGSVIMGAVITPLLLPVIPGRAFAWKGWFMGFIWTVLFVWFNRWFALNNLLLGIGYLLVMPSLAAFIAMDFTGSSTYTSFSGVMKEMKISLPLIISSSAIGTLLVLIKSFIG